MSRQTTLYLADDHQIIIDGLKLLLSDELGFNIVGTANDGNTACNDLQTKKPDIALIDLRMPGMTGLELLLKLKKTIDTRFIILSMYNERRYINDAFYNGAYGYLLKNTDKKELLICLDVVIKGEKYFRLNKPDKTIGNTNSLFTPREIEIIKYVIQENTTHDIAEKLHLSPFTVETHRKNICKKTNTNTVLALYKFIIENRIDIQ